MTRPAARAGLAAALLAAGACATAPARDGPDLTDSAVAAASQPLRDLGMMREEPPPALARIADPYAPPDGEGCAWITHELAALNQALGPDPATGPATAVTENRTLGERGGEAARRAAADAIADAGRGLMPGRGIVRRLSGAEASETRMREAVSKGQARRAFLRGLAAAQSCPARPPAGAAPP